MTALGLPIWERLSAWEGAALTICATRRGTSDRVWAGKELHAAARRRGAAILDAFGGTERPLVLAMPHGEEFVISLLGSIYAGVTVVPVALPRPGVQQEKFNRILADCGAAAVLCLDEARGAIDMARGDKSGPAIIALTELADRQELAAPRSFGKRPALIQYTSGSSRFPRGVNVTGENVVANAGHCFAAWGFDERQVVVNWLPHFHDMGLIGGIIFPILAGAASHQLDPLHAIQRPARWLRVLSDTRATFSGGPAFGFSHCLQQVRDEDCEGLDLSHWTAAYCGAEPVPSDLLEAFRNRFARYGLAPTAVFGCYGLAEYTLMAAGAHGETPGAESDAPPGCANVEPCRLTAALAETVRIVDPDRRTVLPDREPGEIWLRGPSAAAGYVGDASASAATFDGRLADATDDGPWLRTGDLGVIDRGMLYVTGRMKDVLTVMGRKVAASEIEWLAAHQDRVLNPMAATALMRDEMVSGEGVLLIEMRKARTRPADAAALGDRIRQLVLGSFGIDLVDIRFLDRGTLPRTSSGKIQRRAAKMLYWQGHFGACPS
jgi:acyl-CoA synthetase (AMP-forming)/AMP-acid ligase II